MAFSPSLTLAGKPHQDWGPHQGVQHPRRVQGLREIPRLHDHCRRQGTSAFPLVPAH